MLQALLETICDRVHCVQFELNTHCYIQYLCTYVYAYTCLSMFVWTHLVQNHQEDCGCLMRVLRRDLKVYGLLDLGY